MSLRLSWIKKDSCSKLMRPSRKLIDRYPPTWCPLCCRRPSAQHTYHTVHWFRVRRWAAAYWKEPVARFLRSSPALGLIWTNKYLFTRHQNLWLSNLKPLLPLSFFSVQISTFFTIRCAIFKIITSRLTDFSPDMNCPVFKYLRRKLPLLSFC